MWGNGLGVGETAKICGKLRRSVGNGLSILKGLKNVGNDLEIWEMSKIFGK